MILRTMGSFKLCLCVCVCAHVCGVRACMHCVCECVWCGVCVHDIHCKVMIID